MQINRLYPGQYPLLLKQISRPPKFIDIIGTLPKDDSKYLCIVGSRHPSDYGKKVCQMLISGLKGHDVVIVSGLAIGIDSLVHEIALENSIRTIAFPGSGLSYDVLYPSSRLNLARKIISTGNCLLSPFEEKQIATPWTFPVRNRLMAGISHATMVVEGKIGSGTLLTAKHALEFNRDVLIIPGSIFSDLSYGPHSLYKEGAIPITSTGEILDVLGFKYKAQLSITNDQLGQRRLEQFNLNADERNILNIINTTPISISDLIQKSAISVIKLNIILSQLELNGLIEINKGIIEIKL